MNWNEVKKKAVQHGFVFVAHRKKHDEYYNEAKGVTIMIERHWTQEVRKGLAAHLKAVIGF